ncbi:PREDICTED: probable RNA-dependent RNA polymerase 1 isoform X1 [Acropora digitifera]|uniref:probable RNA-dependent RNA polymerase 1 isoform X1 n=1 Tax=Acropora digitifera TaxID=70779 RepID=UPI00077AB16E|nr:PREDICTED: probable RNA-dependent RNA polymerase 1 isoform X1 [Acropora digitifera]XP_015768394.1 PREDICTED: probable RNA-dependent RNA polymerase 1 isoform X1 [Acropora digitifera]
MNVCVSVPKDIVPPNEDFIKHVEFNGENERKYSFAYKKLEKTLFFKCLESKESFSLHEQLMAVTFNTSMQEEANIKLCKDILKKGIFCDGKIFHFLGHSSSQLREKTCFMMQGSNQEIQSHLKNFGEFVELSDVNIRAKKIGLLFSPFHYCVEVDEDPWERFRFIDSDGPHFMSQEFAAKMKAVMNVNYPEPSVLLIHYQGFQRILLSRKEQVSVNSPQLEFHESTWPVANLQEVSRNYASNLAYILDYSRPRQNAHLDAKLVMLLVARGVQIKDLRALQTDCYRLLENMCNDSASKDYFLRLTGRTIEGSQTHVDIGTLRREEVRNIVERNRSGTEVPRVRILFPKARVVFGVPELFEDLKIDECYFKPTLPHEDRMEFEAEKKTFVVRIPCYYPGDIRVFKLCHENPWYQHLSDCLVLPINAGADLGGNQFIVCWDAKLIPKQQVKPCSYLPTLGETMYDTWNRFRSFWCGRSREKNTKELREELIDHFARFKDDLPSRIDQVYLDLARRDSGLSFPECEELSRMYYQATNHTVDKEYLWNRLEEFELGLPEGGEEEQAEEDEEDSMEEEGRNGSLEKPLSYITRQFRVGGKMLECFERAASAFVQKAKRNHFFD